MKEHMKKRAETLRVNLGKLFVGLGKLFKKVYFLKSAILKLRF